MKYWKVPGETVLEDGEGKESSRQHFHLPAIMKEELERLQEEKAAAEATSSGKERQGYWGGGEGEWHRLLPLAPGMDSRLTSLILDLVLDLYESHLYAPHPAETQVTSESFRILTVSKLNITLPDVVTQGSPRLSLSLSVSLSNQGNGKHHERETEEKPTLINFNIKTKEHHI